MVHALGPLGLGGQFAHTMELGLALMVEWRELIVALTEPCLMLAPVNDWVAPVMTPFVGLKEPKESKESKEKELVKEKEAPEKLALLPTLSTFAGDPQAVKESHCEWPTVGVTSIPAPPVGPPPPPPPEPSDGSEGSESHGTQARDEEDEEDDGGRSDTSAPRGDEECLLAQDREDVDDPLESVFQNDLRERGRGVKCRGRVFGMACATPSQARGV
eukprot:symbB.v1.2.025141.t1/scaffold2424.1/size79531/3